MNAPLQILVNGEPCSERWPLDRALQYGDGLFETMRVRQGVIRFRQFHAARLREGCERLGITADHALLWEQAAQVATTRGEALLRLQLTRGDAVARGYSPTGTELARSILSVFDAPSDAELPHRVRAVTLPDRLGENPVLAGLKHCNRLEQVLARRALQPSGAFEGLMGSSSGRLVSGTMSNVFLELDGALVTPSVELCGVAGVMRAVVLREAVRAGLPLHIVPLPLESLRKCSAMALSNARLGLLPVDELDGRDLPRSEMLRSLAQRVDALET